MGADDLVASVSSPRNLTEIGVQFTELQDRFRDDPTDGQVGVGLHSIDPLVMYAEIESVYQFLQVLTGRIRSMGWFGAVVSNEVGLDGDRSGALKHHFDGTIETRTNGDRREHRFEGFAGADTEWRPF